MQQVHLMYVCNTAGAHAVRVQYHLRFQHAVSVQHQLHFQNVSGNVMCEHNCKLPDCMNSVQTNLVSVAPSKLIPGAGLFACEDDDDVF